MRKTTLISSTAVVLLVFLAWRSSVHRAPTAPPPEAAPVAVKSPPPIRVEAPPAPDKVVSTNAPIPEPKAELGRVALSFVGADPNADAVWCWAINDPNLPDESRKNLIEDLNEDGLSDPKHPGPDDLPLIVNRLHLIADLAPYAMDQINHDAFNEAFKDLAIMYSRLTR